MPWPTTLTKVNLDADTDAVGSARAELEAAVDAVNNIIGSGAFSVRGKVAAPTANDDASNTSGNGIFDTLSTWIDEQNDKAYICVDATATAAVWIELSGAGATQTLTNKNIDLANNTVTGTTAEFNTALSDDDFATHAGTETLTNKTVNLTSNTLTGTTAEFNTALSDDDFATHAGTETLTNKTLTAAKISDSSTTITNANGSTSGANTVFGVATTQAITVTLSTADVIAGKEITVIDKGGLAATYNITVAREGGENIDGVAADLTINANYGHVRVKSDGTGWFTV